MSNTEPPHPKRHTHLAREDVPKGGEGVIQGLVVNGVFQVLDEDVADTRLAKSWVSLGPHDADGLAFDHLKVHFVQCPLRWTGGEKGASEGDFLSLSPKRVIGS